MLFEWDFKRYGEKPEEQRLIGLIIQSDAAKNCKWSTPVDYSRNRRNKNLITRMLDIAKRMLNGESAKSISQEYCISRKFTERNTQRKNMEGCV